VVSDHGFRGHHSCFDINEYLISKGLLVLSDASQAERLKASRVSKLRQDIAHAGLRPLARTAKRYLKAAGIWRSAGIDATQPLLTGINWEKTLAYAPSFSGFQGGYADIFFHPHVGRDLIAEVSEDLKYLYNPKNGKPLIEAIYTTDVFGSGPYAPGEPHLLLLAQEGVTFRMDLGNVFLWEDFGKTFGSHHRHGVLYAYGAPFKRGFRAPDAEIFDLVPTVLSTMSLSFSCDFDGRVLQELFAQEPSPEHKLVIAGKGAEGSIVSAKLKHLLASEGRR
jgi:predicted AlkP superfamily phosphohydrolase/phosphomutase